jgi:hypothetical protein
MMQTYKRPILVKMIDNVWTFRVEKRTGSLGMKFVMMEIDEILRKMSGNTDKPLVGPGKPVLDVEFLGIKKDDMDDDSVLISVRVLYGV